MTENNLWQIDHYRSEYFSAKMECLVVKTELENYKKYIQFLEEKYKIRSTSNFKEEFEEWCKNKEKD
jgi:flagellar biosynthesis chaperone FliJ